MVNPLQAESIKRSFNHAFMSAWCINVYDVYIEPYEYNMQYFVLVRAKRGGKVYPGIKWYRGAWNFCDRKEDLGQEIFNALKAAYKTEQVMNLWGYYNGFEGIYRHLSGRRGQCDPEQIA
jgi:hypothetical protein